MTTEAAKSDDPGDWPTLLKDNARTGGHQEHSVRSPERAVWQYRAGSSVRSAPILEGGILYVASANGVLHAVDVLTGSDDGLRLFDSAAVFAAGREPTALSA